MLRLCFNSTLIDIPANAFRKLQKRMFVFLISAIKLRRGYFLQCECRVTDGLWIVSVDHQTKRQNEHARIKGKQLNGLYKKGKGIG